MWAGVLLQGKNWGKIDCDVDECLEVNVYLKKILI